MEERKHYVYALCCGTAEDSLTPFYIGKGKGSRMYQHFTAGQLAIAGYKSHKIKKELSLGNICKPFKLYENLTNGQAEQLERETIAYFQGCGVKLTNVYAGGDNKAYSKNNIAVQDVDLAKLVLEFLQLPGVKLLTDWIAFTQGIFTIGTAKNVWRHPAYAEFRAQFVGFGGLMSSEQKQENTRRKSAKTSGANNPMAKPLLNQSQVLIAAMLSGATTVRELRTYVQQLGYSTTPLRSLGSCGITKPKPVKLEVQTFTKTQGLIAELLNPEANLTELRAYAKSLGFRLGDYRLAPKPQEPKPLSLEFSDFEKAQVLRAYTHWLVLNPREPPAKFLEKCFQPYKFNSLQAYWRRKGLKVPIATGDKSRGGRATALKICMPVESYDLRTGKTIAQYLSATYAAKALGLSQGNIRCAAYGGSKGGPKTAGGLGWRFIS